MFEKVEEEGVLEKVGDDVVVVYIYMGMLGFFCLYQFLGIIVRVVIFELFLNCIDFMEFLFDILNFDDVDVCYVFF